MQVILLENINKLGNIGDISQLKMDLEEITFKIWKSFKT